MIEISKLNNQTDRLQISCTNAKFGRRFGNDSQTVDANAARRRASRGINRRRPGPSVSRPSLERLPCVCRGPRGIPNPPHPWRERQPTVARAFAMRLPRAARQSPSVAGRSPVCVRLCLVRSPDREKRLPQPSWSQANGRSPICMRLCAVRLLAPEKRSRLSHELGLDEKAPDLTDCVTSRESNKVCGPN